ncbi:MAG: hypothetical protein GX542_09315, partial [Rhodococcus sp.]|nr:hypothetical protein [Rhodococcus sp. (in: high G+C Gram-positive bacteria)]
PPGTFFGTIAVLNDTHVGEDKHGLLIGDFPPAIEQEPGLTPFPEVMLSAALREIRGLDVRHLVINGDLTSEARPAEVRRTTQILSEYGQLGRDYSVTRGNHDRPHTVASDPDAGYDSASPIPDTEHFDPFGDAFVPFQTAWTKDIGALRIVGVDSTHLDNSGGVIAESQFTEIERTLAEDPTRPTLMLAHHPVTREAALTNLGGPGFILAEPDRQRLQQLHAANPGVFLMLAGHTHRARVTRGDTGARVHYLETGSAAGYPGGYTLIHLYSGGYQVNFHRTSSEDALAWTRRSRFAALTFLPEYTLGSCADRNHTVIRDLSGLT